MLSYQHIYHAGCLADVHKHQYLAKILGGLDQPITYFETHAGRGLYDLSAPEALKTGEAEAGINSLLRDKHFHADNPYYKALVAIRKKYGRTAYPGSPLIARQVLGSDRPLHLYELHPQEFAHLQGTMALDKNIHTYKQDGYEGILSNITGNSVILIDPSYEVKNEYMQAAIFIENLSKRAPDAVILLWYPILRAQNHLAMLDYLDHLKLPVTSRDEIMFPPARKGMLGSGIFAVNVKQELLIDI